MLNSDILIYTLPLNNNTRNLVDKKSFDKMKKDQLLLIHLDLIFLI